MRLNPDWKVILWHPLHSFTGRSWGSTSQELFERDSCKDYFPELWDLPITKSPVDFDSLGFGSNFAEVHKADYIRINALSLYGGVWSDMDIIYFKPLEQLAVNKPENAEKETYVCIGNYGHSTGFNMAKPESRFFTKLRDVLSVEYKSYGYQCWGPDIFNKYFKSFKSIPNAVNLSMDVVYAHNCHQVAELINEKKGRFNGESIGCHWYAGNELWVRFLNETGGGVRNLPDTIIGQLINGV